MTQGIAMKRPETPAISRRDWIKYSGLGMLGMGASPYLPVLAAQSKQQRRHCVLLWMSGGPTQTDTFDMKVGHANGGEFKEISTAAPGVKFSENFPQLAKHADQLAVVRSLSTKEGDHGRGT